MLAFIKSIPTLIKTTKFWIIAILLALVMGSVVYFVNDYKTTLQELAVAEQNVNDLTLQIDNVNKKIKDEKVKTQNLRQSNDRISNQYLSTIRELNELKARYQDLIDNPEENEIKIEQSFNNYMNDISCITGESTQC
ncbi:MAG: hypothetical protein R3230_00455 [Nitrosopumilaceae archaeon]|nr:hypothetical protein [Nitrosopumilaceae archaeon]